MEQEQLLIALARTLERLKIPYLVTGGIAVVVWGRPRFTADIDIVVELRAEQAGRLARALKRIGREVYVDAEEVAVAVRAGGEFGFFDPRSGLRVDFWMLKDDAFDRERLHRRIRRRIAGVPVYFSSPEDLILMKLLWRKESGSERQLEDVASILRMQRKLDLGYLRRWAKAQGTIATLDKLLAAP